MTPRTRLALVSHVTSTTALVLPVERIVRELADRGVDTLVDGAHAPGQVPLDLDAIGAAYYDRQRPQVAVRPEGRRLPARPGGPARRHPARSSSATARTTRGPTGPGSGPSSTGPAPATRPPILAIPAALDFLGGLRAGGWPELMASNHALALAARDRVGAAVGAGPTAPDAMIGAMAALPLPDDLPMDVKARLYDEYRIEVPVSTWPVDAALEPGEVPRARLLRVSAQAYNDETDVERLATALRGLRSRS